MPFVRVHVRCLPCIPGQRLKQRFGKCQEVGAVELVAPLFPWAP